MAGRRPPNKQGRDVMKKKDAKAINECLKKCFSESAACVRDNNGLFICKTYTECKDQCSEEA